jgi:hypothetical protein
MFIGAASSSSSPMPGGRPACTRSGALAVENSVPGFTPSDIPARAVREKATENTVMYSSRGRGRLAVTCSYLRLELPRTDGREKQNSFDSARKRLQNDLSQLEEPLRVALLPETRLRWAATRRGLGEGTAHTGAPAIRTMVTGGWNFLLGLSTEGGGSHWCTFPIRICQAGAALSGDFDQTAMPPIG